MLRRFRLAMALAIGFSAEQIAKPRRSFGKMIRAVDAPYIKGGRLDELRAAAPHSRRRL